MRNWTRPLVALFFCLALAITSGQADAQRRGGSSRRTGGRTALVFDYAPELNGRVPQCSGSIQVTTYVTTVSVDLKLSNVELPDNTTLYVTAYAVDYFNGNPWPSVLAGTLTVSSRKGALNSGSLYITGPGLLPLITYVVVTDENGNVIVSGHP